MSYVFSVKRLFSNPICILYLSPYIVQVVLLNNVTILFNSFKYNRTSSFWFIKYAYEIKIMYGIKIH